jgi:uncharacterized membrane protein
MKALVLTLMTIVLLVVLVVPYGSVLGAGQLEYSIQVGNDGSATWTVTQTLGINSTIETLETLQNRITTLVNASENTTGRAMAASVDSLTFTESGSYVEAVYKFQWENFSEVEGEEIITGDVFQVSNFFSQYLYGDGAVYMSYPPDYVVVGQVQPQPSTRNDSIQLLSWLGTNDFNGGTRIVLEKTYTLSVNVAGSGSTTPSGTITYPANSSVSVEATPNPGYEFMYWVFDDVDVGNQNPYTVLMNSNHALTAFFKVTSSTPRLLGSLEEDAVLIAILAAIAAGSVGFYVLRYNRKKKMKAPETAELRNLSGIESDEEKTVKLIKSSGGNLRQSAITDQLGFSKAKTSQLLAVLEHNGVIRRYKRGRDKIVVLVEENKGETL